jgi:hypothetical protein
VGAQSKAMRIELELKLNHRYIMNSLDVSVSEYVIGRWTAQQLWTGNGRRELKELLIV